MEWNGTGLRELTPRARLGIARRCILPAWSGGRGTPRRRMPATQALRYVGRCHMRFCLKNGTGTDSAPVAKMGGDADLAPHRHLQVPNQIGGDAQQRDVGNQVENWRMRDTTRRRPDSVPALRVSRSWCVESGERSGRRRRRYRISRSRRSSIE